MKVLAVIPARGGSKGIPRKNLRTLVGRPLLSYSIAAARGSKHAVELVISTDDEEIASLGAELGVEVCMRPAELADDSTPLDPVIFHVVEEMEKKGRSYDVVLTIQPTSPLLRSASIDRALDIMEAEPQIETMISAREDRHLTWRVDSKNRFVPNYAARVNRQLLEPIYRETGGILACRRQAMTTGSRIGASVSLLTLSEQESIDIDSFEDWKLCEFYLSRKKIVIVVHGRKEVGMGHVYNMLSLAADLTDHEILFLVPKNEDLARLAIATRNFKFVDQTKDDLISEIRSLEPDVVINDILNTDKEYVEGLKAFTKLVVNFEDLGPGAGSADLVFNAIYPEEKTHPGHYYGHRYVLLRDEFLLPVEYKVKTKVRSVLLTFGGTDPSNLTLKTLDAVYSYLLEYGVEIRVVIGLGYPKASEMQERFPKAQIYRDVKFISEHMRKADIAFTSAGRTTFEVASIGVPSIVLSQNAKEMTHFFASSEFGFKNLGLGKDVSREAILSELKKLMNDHSLRVSMSRKMASFKVKEGRARVGRILRERLELI